jgi:hypothetical protein
MRRRFEARRAQLRIKHLEERIAPTPEQRVHLVTEGSEHFPCWCVHVQKDGLSSLLLSTRC